MTKAEAQRMADLEKSVAMARSLRWPEYAVPAAMTEAEIRANLKQGGIKYGQPEYVCRGWFPNGYSGRVTYGCSNGTTHNSDGETTNTQNMGRMFLTEADAWRVVRYEMTLRFAEELARIDEELRESS